MNRKQDIFKNLYAKFRHQIYGFLYRSVRNQDVALDLMQDVFLNFFRVFAEKEIPDEAHCRMYLFRAARNIVINYQRSAYQKRVFSHNDPELFVVPSATSKVEATIVNTDTTERTIAQFHELLSRLNEMERHALILRYEQEMTIEQVAQVLDLSLTTAFRLLKKAKQRLVAEGKKIGFDPSTIE